MRLVPLLCLCLGIVPSSTALADNFTDLTLNATFAGRGVTPTGTDSTSTTFTGTTNFQLDTTTGLVSDQAITLHLSNGINFILGFGQAQGDQSVYGNFTQLFFFGPAQGALTLDIPSASLVGYAGGPVCTLSAPCAPTTQSWDPNDSSLTIASYPYQYQYDVTSGSLTATPEPSTLLLLGTGLLTLAGRLRRRPPAA